MSRKLTLIKKLCAMLFAVLLIQTSANAITYTAVASGNFSSAATWSGGNVPSQTILLDQINIGAGLTVTLDQTFVMNGLLSGMNVDGSLVSSNNSALILTTGTLSGNGNIDVDSLSLGLTSGFTFTGTLTADDFSSTSLNSTTSADVTITNQFWLGGSLDFLTNSSLTLGNNSNIIVAGGLFSNSGGSLNLTGNYNVVYTGSSSNSGLELSGAGLQSITLNLGNNNSNVNLASNVTLNGMLTLNSGNLVLNGNNLTIGSNGNIAVSGSGSIVSTSQSHITINATNGTNGFLHFNGNGNSVNNLTINVGSGNQSGFTGHLTVNGALNLQSGTTNFSNGSLTIAGTLTGNGSLYGNNGSDLDITAAAGLTTSLVFATGGNNVDDVTIGTGSGTSVSLGSDLHIHGDLAIGTNNQFNISDDELTIDGAVTGSGTFTTNSNSGLFFTGGSSITLNITGGNGTIGDLGFDGDNSSTSLTLTGDLIIAGSFNNNNGVVILAGNDLTISSTGDITAGGNGTIFTTSSSNINILATGGTQGGLHFGGNGNTVNNVIIDLGSNSGSQTSISGTLNIVGDLELTSGTFNFSNTTLTLDGTISGSGTLSGNSNSDLNVTADLGLATDLNFASNGQNIGDLNIGTGTGTSVSLGTALTINGDLTIIGGTQFDITDENLTINGNIVGAGTLTTNSGSGLVLNTSSNNSLNITGSTGTIGTLGYNGSNGSTTLQLTGDLTVATSLSLQGGTFDLNDNDLTITGGIAAGGSGTINSTSSSSISIVTNATLAGGLTFNSNGNNVDDFTVDLGTGGSLDLNSDLNVNGTLSLDGGIIDIDDNDLTIAVGGSVSGGSDSSYVNTNGGGSLVISLTANTSGTFAVGTDDEYAPAIIDLNNGSGSGSVGVSVKANVMAQGTAGSDISSNQSVVDATWHVTSDISANLDLDLQVMWSSNLEVNSFDRGNAYISHYTNSAWDVTADVAATVEANGMFSLRRENITSLSPFAVFDDKTVTGIKETANAIEFKMFPVPATSAISFTYNETTNSDMKVDIMDVQGSVLATYNLGGSNSAVSVSNLASGTYLARVYNNNVNSVQRFTKM